MTGLPVRCTGLVHLYRLEGSDVVALAGVDLDIAAGEQVALVGPSGSGKSTLLGLLAGLFRASAGRVRVGPYEYGLLSDAELTGLRCGVVGVVLQGAVRNLLPYATVRDNVALGRRGLPAGLLAGAEPLEDLLGLLGLDGVADRRAGGLTAGEQQRVALAAAMSAGPGVLLADEPTSRLDVAGRGQVLDALRMLSAERGTTVVIVTHDAEVGRRQGRVVTMRDGRAGLEARRGEDYSVVGRDGSLALPAAVLEAMPPGTALRVELAGDGSAHVVPRDAGTGRVVP